MSEESHIVSVCVASGQEIVGKVIGELGKPFLMVTHAAFILRPPGQILAQASLKHDNFMSRDMVVNTSGAYIVELHPNSKLFGLWEQTQSNILMPHKKAIGRIN
uniref:Uncharacterized protein n=1 Tax=viral metagenome TaxID=1070528 RepID=A0A6M3JSK6_9ZZZZ